MKHVRALRTTLWCALLAQTTPTPSLHSPEKSSVRLVHHQNLTVHPHLPGSTHVHAYPCVVRHQFRILMNTAASTVDLAPPHHPTTPTNSKLDVLPSSCLLMCICTRKGIHVHVTARSHISPTCDRQPIDRQLSVPAYAQAHVPVHLHTCKHTHPHLRASSPTPALHSAMGSRSFLTSMRQQLGAGRRVRNAASELVKHSSGKHQPGCPGACCVVLFHVLVEGQCLVAIVGDGE
jgi:hypothetical protein